MFLNKGRKLLLKILEWYFGGFLFFLICPGLAAEHLYRYSKQLAQNVLLLTYLCYNLF